MIALRALPIAALALAFAAPAIADSWARPVVREVFSASRDHFVRVTPGTAIDDTFGFGTPGKGAAKGKYATAEFYRRQPDRSYQLMHSDRKSRRLNSSHRT